MGHANKHWLVAKFSQVGASQVGVSTISGLCCYLQIHDVGAHAMRPTSFLYRTPSLRSPAQGELHCSIRLCILSLSRFDPIRLTRRSIGLTKMHPEARSLHEVRRSFLFHVG